MNPVEFTLREKLGIPPEAKKVLVFAESSHWDPDWLYTSQEYYQRWVGTALDQALVELQLEPRRIYSVECMFFLRMHWEHNPQQQALIRDLVNAGRLRLTSSGVTTADTLAPDAEAILADWLVGQEWLRANGMHQEPRLAYFPDCFGHSPALPALLRAAGYDMTAFARIDGMFGMGADYDPRRSYPKPGSSAELLQKQEKTLDFIWRAPDGSEALAHWCAFSYGQGDMLAYRGMSRIYLFNYSALDPTDKRVAGRIAEYVDQLAPLSPTPYLFCPIGADFVAPIPGLVSLLDRYNRNHSPQSGIWAVNAGLDDYLALVGCQRAKLPVLQLDPNPYWTGFYTSRPSLKQRSHLLWQSLRLADQKKPGADLHEAWWTAATSNHHDFITGTAPDRVSEQEQTPMLKRALEQTRAVLKETLSPAGPQTPSRQAAAPHWERQGGVLRVETEHYCLELSEAQGGCITRAWLPGSNTPLLVGPSNELVDHRESGGLWRMGHEYGGGYYRETGRSGAAPAHIQVNTAEDGALEVSSEATLGRQTLRQTLRFCAGDPLIYGRVEGLAQDRHTLTLRFASGLAVERLVMEAPGGWVERPLHKIYTPTFWPAQQFVHLVDSSKGGRGLALLLGRSGAVTCTADGVLEAVAIRNATRELVFGLIPILATPATGHEKEVTAFCYALAFTAAGDWRDNQLSRRAREFAHSRWGLPELAAWQSGSIPLPTPDSSEVLVESVKPAWRGPGSILRLFSWLPTGTPITLQLSTGRSGADTRPYSPAAWLCDARERDLSELEVRDGRIHLALPGAVTSIRIVTP